MAVVSARRYRVMESERPAHRPAVLRTVVVVLAADLPLQALLEPLDLTGRVDDVLRAREERVAVAADVDAQLLSRRPDRPFATARAAVDLRFVILGMDIRLHGCLSSDVFRARPSPGR